MRKSAGKVGHIMNELSPRPRLWTRDFTIITLGTVVSMLGNATAGFAISLLVLEYTGSTLLYSIYLAAYNLPKVIMPLVAGPYLDSFSRKKTIYVLDFCSAAIYFGVFLLLRAGIFSYGPFLALCLVVGAIDSSYQVAYDSLYPTLVSPGNFSRAYSISSLIYPLATMMTPVVTYVYQRVGFAPLFAFNAACFFIAAVFETQIRAPESHLGRAPERASVAYLKSEFKSGLDYIKSEPGLLVITFYFFFMMGLGNISYSLWLPFFQQDGPSGVMLYSYVMGASMLGRLVGGLLHYRLRIPIRHKFTIAICVYACVAILSGAFVFFSPPVMIAMTFTEGILSVNSYNIRVSATQSYVPNEFRARFNGVFLMVTTFGNIIGTLAGGALGEYIRLDWLIGGSQVIGMLAIYFIMYRGREHVKKIYNREV